ncbi:MAG TPA: hypothetical protein VMB82_06085 [Acidimicrobiales bacterium]|nr:hypothetical protein [Acidimicrobiales bacterium]
MTVLAVEHVRRLRFSAAVVLSKQEAFDACEACAEAERALVRSGREAEARRMAALFELLELRLVAEPGLPSEEGRRPAR